MPRHSIIITCYNLERFIAQTIESCLGQTQKDLEVIVVDDGSKDNSAAIIEEIAKRDKRVHLIKQKNAGVGAARNTGLKRAKGEYLTILDGDDLLEPTKLEVQEKILEENPQIGMVLCNALVVDAENNVLQDDHVGYERFKDHPRLQDALFCQGLWPPAIMMGRTRQILKGRPFDPNRQMSSCEDLDFFIRLGRMGFDYLFVQQSLVRYRRISGSLSSDPQRIERATRLVYAKHLRQDADESVLSLRYMQNLLWKTKSELYAQKQIASGSKEFLKKAIPLLTCGGGKETLIWGAGSGGQRVLNVLKAASAQAKAFVDSNPMKTGQEVAGLQVIHPDSFIKKPANERPFVIIASTYAPHIGSDLRAAGWKDNEFYIADFDVVSTLEEVFAASQDPRAKSVCATT